MTEPIFGGTFVSLISRERLHQYRQTSTFWIRHFPAKSFPSENDDLHICEVTPISAGTENSMSDDKNQVLSANADSSPLELLRHVPHPHPMMSLEYHILNQQFVPHSENGG